MVQFLRYCVLFIGLLLNICPAQAARHPQNNKYADIVIDAGTGRVLHATNANSLRHPASLTKMMTLYLTFKALSEGKLRLNQPLPISVNASSQEPTKLGLQPGRRISVKNAILSLVTQSANDSAVVLAEALRGNEANFGQAMTRQAAALGMIHTHFSNPSGLPAARQVTTASDMAKLGSALLHRFPKFYGYFSLDKFAYGGNVYHNHNHLMQRYPGMDGIKTGYIQTSGFNLVASAKRGHTRLIGVIFGGHSPVSRDQRMAQLLNMCFGKVKPMGSHSSSFHKKYSRRYSLAKANIASSNKRAISLKMKMSEHLI